MLSGCSGRSLTAAKPAIPHGLERPVLAAVIDRRYSPIRLEARALKLAPSGRILTILMPNHFPLFSTT